MSLTMRKPGRIGRPMNIDIYLDVLKERLANESKGHIRKYIRQKITRLSDVNNGKETDKIKKTKNGARATPSSKSHQAV